METDRPAQYPQFLDQMEAVFGLAIPPEEKVAEIENLMAVYRKAISNIANPGEAKTIHNLAERISQLSQENPELKARTAHVVKDLHTCADGFQFPDEIMLQIVGESPQGWRLTSKHMEGHLTETYKESLWDLNFRTPPEVLAYVMKFKERIRFLDLSSIPHTLNQLDQLMVHLPKLNGLILTSFHHLRATPEQVIEFAKKYGAKMVSLDISFIKGFTKAQIEELMGYLPQLKELKASCTKLKGETLSALLAHATQLRNLDLAVNDLGLEEARQIAEAPLSQLEALSLSDNELNGAALALISSSKHLTRLEKLNLINNPLGPAGAEALGSSPLISRLKGLLLWGCKIKNEGVEKLLQPADLQLLELDLGKNDLSLPAIGALASASQLSQLQRLKLDHNGLGDWSAYTFAKPSQLKSLRRLELRDNEIGSDGALALAYNFSIPEITLNNNPFEGEKEEYALYQRSSLAKFTPEQRQQLFDQIIRLAQEEKVAIQGEPADWVRKHLYDDQSRFLKAFKLVNK